MAKCSLECSGECNICFFSITDSCSEEKKGEDENLFKEVSAKEAMFLIDSNALFVKKDLLGKILEPLLIKAQAKTNIKRV